MIRSNRQQDRPIAIRAAAIIVRGRCVLLHRSADDGFWTLPGGRVEWGETGAQAVERELREELGWRSDVLTLRWTVENFFQHHGRQHHELGLYFDTLVDEAISAAPVSREPNLQFAWFAFDVLGELPLRPAFLSSAFNEPPIAHRVVEEAPPLTNDGHPA